MSIEMFIDNEQLQKNMFPIGMCAIHSSKDWAQIKTGIRMILTKKDCLHEIWVAQFFRCAIDDSIVSTLAYKWKF